MLSNCLIVLSADWETGVGVGVSRTVGEVETAIAKDILSPGTWEFRFQEVDNSIGSPQSSWPQSR